MVSALGSTKKFFTKAAIQAAVHSRFRLINGILDNPTNIWTPRNKPLAFRLSEIRKPASTQAEAGRLGDSRAKKREDPYCKQGSEDRNR